MNILPYPTLWRADSDRVNYQAPKAKERRIKTHETKKHPPKWGLKGGGQGSRKKVYPQNRQIIFFSDFWKKIF